jgi:hypothetical protein
MNPKLEVTWATSHEHKEEVGVGICGRCHSAATICTPGRTPHQRECHHFVATLQKL